ncbi:MAG: hypothetical protein AB8U25_03215 [Rickettsiales endosymbiont of Dermacentor nuttalli]
MRVNDYKDSVSLFTYSTTSPTDFGESSSCVPPETSIDVIIKDEQQLELSQHKHSKKLEFDKEMLYQEYLFTQICADCAHKQAKSYIDNNLRLSHYYQSIYNMYMAAAKSSLENINKCERKMLSSYKLNV